MKGKNIRLIISGSTGKMGRSLRKTLDKNREGLFGDFEIVFSASSSDLKICDASVIIDFSEASFSIEILKQAVEKKIPMVIGTTGFDDNQLKFIKKASKKIPLFLVPNTSLGIAVLKQMIHQAATLGFIESSTKVKILEKHQKEKKDIPSGTSKDIVNFLKEFIFKNLNIQIESIREEDIAGEHSISLINQNEILTISHKVLNRSIYSEGALALAMKLIEKKKPGLYLMSDIYLPNQD